MRVVSDKDKMSGASGGILLIGLGIIVLAEIDVFPWILVVIGLASLPGSIASEGLWAGLQTAIWLIGLAILFALGIIWPGVLILMGLSLLAGALKRPPMLKSKPKRGLPVDGEDY